MWEFCFETVFLSEPDTETNCSQLNGLNCEKVSVFCFPYFEDRERLLGLLCMGDDVFNQLLEFDLERLTI